MNKLIIAAAGSGKTTYIINEALNLKDNNILITTYTEANESEIHKIIVNKNKCIPKNVKIQTWFSFLIQHGARPFQNRIYNKDINGLLLVNCQSAPFINETNVDQHYFTDIGKIYSDKLAKFVIKCNAVKNNAVIERLEKIFNYIYIDEVQDLAGYDLEFLKLIFSSKINVILVGDPRQGTYSTNNSSKNKKYRKSDIVHFFEDDSLQIDKNDQLLLTNYRCVEAICNFSNTLYPDLPRATSGNVNPEKKEHIGVFLVKSSDVPNYLKTFQPIQLRYSANTKVNDDYPFRTYGDSKGLSYDRVLIYLTSPLKKWLEDKTNDLKPTSRSKFYVAITRARFSVGLVYDYLDDTHFEGIEKYIPV